MRKRKSAEQIYKDSGLGVLEELKEKLESGSQKNYIKVSNCKRSKIASIYRFSIIKRRLMYNGSFIYSHFIIIDVNPSTWMIEVNGESGELKEIPEDYKENIEGTVLDFVLPRVIKFFWEDYYSREPKRRTISGWWREIEIIQEIGEFVEEKKKSLDPSRTEGG